MTARYVYSIWVPSLLLAASACGAGAEFEDGRASSGGEGNGGADGGAGAASGGGSVSTGGEGNGGGANGGTGGVSGGSGPANGGGGSPGGGAGGASGGSPAAGPCPADAPAPGATCTQLNLFCSYGDDPRWECRTVATCLSGINGVAWDVPNQAATCADPPLPPECPAAPATGACTAPPAQCVYADGTLCLCTDCSPNAPVCQMGDASWVCLPPPEGCPSSPPNAGTACAEPDGTVCQYTCARRIACNAGLWERLREQCPACAAPDTPIDTGTGSRPIREIKVGDPVYAMVEDRRILVNVVETGRARQSGHSAAEVVLESGVVLQISADHPLPDGRTLADLVPGELLGPFRVYSLSMVPYEHLFTYDIKTSAPDGSYLAAGVPIGSTFTSPEAQPATRSGQVVHRPSTAR